VRAALAIQRALVDLDAHNAVTGAPEHRFLDRLSRL
jgi:hypothetical protein